MGQRNALALSRSLAGFQPQKADGQKLLEPHMRGGFGGGKLILTSLAGAN